MSFMQDGSGGYLTLLLAGFSPTSAGAGWVSLSAAAWISMDRHSFGCARWRWLWWLDSSRA